MAADPFAAALESYLQKGHGSFVLTREDGYADREDAAPYFAPFRKWPRYERRILQFARGRVLDVGCGPGRHSLYLQEHGFEVTGLERSSRVARIACKRGLRDVRVGSACRKLEFHSGEFETVLLLGHNLGLCGDRAGTRRLLRELRRVTRAGASLLCTSRAPGVTNPRHLQYWTRVLKRGGEMGAARFKIEAGGERRWVRLLLLAPAEFAVLARGEGWELQGVVAEQSDEQGWAGVLARLR